MSHRFATTAYAPAHRQVFDSCHLPSFFGMASRGAFSASTWTICFWTVWRVKPIVPTENLGIESVDILPIAVEGTDLTVPSGKMTRPRATQFNSGLWATSGVTEATQKMETIRKSDLVGALCKTDSSNFLNAKNMGGEYFVIDRNAHLFLARVGDGSREALANSVQEVWNAIPDAAAKRDMQAFWEKGAAGEPWAPKIEMTKKYEKCAGYFTMGRALMFNSQAVDMMVHDGILNDVIGHELAHAWQHTQKGSVLLRDGATEKEIEDDADAIATGWGFDMPRMRQWGTTNEKVLKTFGINNPQP
jgi:hypothetical protein